MKNKYFIIVREYGLKWIFFRLFYTFKIRLLTLFPVLASKTISVQKHINLNIIHLDHKKLEVFYNSISENEKKEILNRADNAASGIIKSFNHMDLSYGNPINWYLNPKTQKEISKGLYWFQIPDFDSKVGDIKYVWEPARFFQFYDFSKAYLITKNIKYYDAFKDQLNDWLSENLYPYGPHHKCGQEASVRLASVLINYAVFKKYIKIDAKLEKQITRLVHITYKKIQTNYFYSYHAIRNNHTISETAGLIIIALMKDDTRVFKKSINKLNKIIDYQFKEDGGYIQKSFNYQRMALQWITFLLSDAFQSNIQLNSSNMHKINQSLKQLTKLIDLDTGFLPNYGPDDGTLLFPLQINTYKDYRPSLNALSAVINQESLFNDNLSKAEIIWFSSQKKLEQNERIKIEKNIAFKSSDINFLAIEPFKVIVFNESHTTRPTHINPLHMDVWFKSINVFQDSGTFSYAEKAGQKLVNLKNHNSMQLDEIEPMQFIPPFFIYNWITRVKSSVDENSFSGMYIDNKSNEYHRNIRMDKDTITIQDEIIGRGDAINSYLITRFEPSVSKGKAVLTMDSNKIIEITTDSTLIIEPHFFSTHYGNLDKGWRINIQNCSKNQTLKNHYQITLRNNYDN